MRKVVIYTSTALVIIILCTVGILSCTYRKTVLKAREAALAEDLQHMRAGIQRYTQDQKTPPQELSDLVKTGYLQEIPVDPITDHEDWQVKKSLVLGKAGIVAVHSAASQASSTGAPYDEW